jgi:hypothetical protein
MEKLRDRCPAARDGCGGGFGWGWGRWLGGGQCLGRGQGSAGLGAGAEVRVDDGEEIRAHVPSLGVESVRASGEQAGELEDPEGPGVAHGFQRVREGGDTRTRGEVEVVSSSLFPLKGRTLVVSSPKGNSVPRRGREPEGKWKSISEQKLSTSEMTRRRR